MFTVLEMSNTTRPKAEPKYVTYDYFQQQLKSIDNATKQYTRNYINNTVSAIQSNVVNYSALSNQSKSLTDGVRTIDFDSITQSIQFRTNINQTTTPIKIHPITNTINNVSQINFNDSSTITGITSDSSNTDPTKAISANILTGINSRFAALETKTQNQTSTKNETVFVGNVKADTFNGYHLGFNNRFYTLPAIPFINSDLVMEVGRYIDFHYNAASGSDYTSRLHISKPGTLYYDHSFIVKGGDIKARNCISDNGNLHDAINKIAALESKNTEQDTRLDALETKNTEQDTRLDALESKDIAFEDRIGSIEAMDTAQNETLNNINTKNTEQDERLDALYKNKMYVTYEGGTVAPDVTRVIVPELSEELTAVFNIKLTLTFEDKTQPPTLATGTKKLLHYIITYYIIENGEQKLIQADNIISYKNENGNVTWYSTVGFALNNAIIEKGKISFDLSYKRSNHDEPSMWNGSFAGSNRYFKGSVLTQPTINEYFISKNLAYDNEERLSAATNKNNEQDVRLNGFDDSLVEVDNRLNTLESNQITLTMKKFEHYNYNILGAASFANNIFTFVFDEQPTTGTINFAGDFFDGNETRPADFTMYFTNGAYSKMEIVYWNGILTDAFQGEYNSTTLTFKLFGNNGGRTLNSFEESTLSIHMPNEKVITRTQDTKSLNILSDDLADNNVYSASKLLDTIYPIGSIYLTFNQSPPAIGTWELISGGYFLQSTVTSPGETGGSTTHLHKTSGHVLTADEMPTHKHTFKGNKITGTVYDIMKYDAGGQTNKNPEGAFSVNRYGSRTWQGTDGSNRGFSLTFTATPTGSISSEGKNQAHNHGDTEAASNIPPYITCFMYKRTA